MGNTFLTFWDVSAVFENQFVKGPPEFPEVSEKKFFMEYVAVSASVIIWVPKSGESKSGQMVSEKVIWS